MRCAAVLVESADLRSFELARSGKVPDAYSQAMTLAPLLYGCVTDLASSCELEEARRDGLIFRFVSNNHHADHSTLGGFWKRSGNTTRAFGAAKLWRKHNCALSRGNWADLPVAEPTVYAASAVSACDVSLRW